LKFIQR